MKRPWILFIFLMTPSLLQAQVPTYPGGLGINPYPTHYRRLEEKSFFLRESAYILLIDANTMEEAFAQMVRFYERKGWARTDPLYYSGQALIYEESPLPTNKAIFPTEVRTRHIRIATEYLCTKTEGAFRAKYLEDNVLVVHPMNHSILHETPIPKIPQTTTTIAHALQGIVKLANKQNPNVRIRFERPSTVRLRAGEDGSILPLLNKHLAMYQDLPGAVLDSKIQIELFPNKFLIDALAAVVKAHPLPLYLTLRPDPKGTESTHVLTVDTLPDVEVKRIRYADTVYETYWKDWWYLSEAYGKGGFQITN